MRCSEYVNYALQGLFQDLTTERCSEVKLTVVKRETRDDFREIYTQSVCEDGLLAA